MEYNFVQKIKDGGYNRMVNIAGNILLRPNDMKAWGGIERFNTLKTALETILDENKEDQLYTYYYTFDRKKHGFCTFERWKSLYANN